MSTQGSGSKLFLVITLLTALVAYSTNSLSVIFAYYDGCAGSRYVKLTSQAEVDQFPVTFGATCDTINGSLDIVGGDITNLDGLSQLKYVTDRLLIESNTVLTKLNGLGNLIGVGGGVQINSNPALTSLAGLSSLTAVGKQLHIGGNGALTTLGSFASLVELGSLSVTGNNQLSAVQGFPLIKSLTSVTIENNDALTAIAGFDALASSGSVSIQSNGALTLLSGFASLTAINGNLYLASNWNLPAISGFQSLKTVTGTLNIYNHGLLTNFDGLASLQTIGGDAYINYNSSLQLLGGLASLKSVGGYLQVYSNYKLRNMHALRKLTQVGGLSIESNDQLSNLNALLNLEMVFSDLYINYNYNLDECEGIVPLLGWPDGASDYVGGSISIMYNAVGCNSVAEVLSSVSGPGAPAITNVDVSSETAEFEFLPVVSPDALYPVTAYEAVCTSGLDASAVAENNVATPIPDKGFVDSTLTMAGSPSSDSDYLAVSVDITHPLRQDLELRLTSPQATEISLWDFDPTPTSNLVTTFPVPTEPADSFATFNGEDFNGEWTLRVIDNALGDVGVLNNWSLRVEETVRSTGTQSPLPITGLTDFRDYSCTVKAITRLGKGPASSPVMITPQPSPPDAPTITSITRGDGELTVSFVANDEGDAPITSYTATCGTESATGTESPLVVTGLSNDQEYSCTVVASNSIGDSPPSEVESGTPGTDVIYRSNVLDIIIAVEANKGAP